MPNKRTRIEAHESMSVGDQPLVSVVVPAYNESDFISECIESVLAQRYRNWECIIFDNCSTDNTPQIAQRYAAIDNRIRYLRGQTLLRAVANYNAALQQICSESKYCKIVFADDWIFPECLEKMVALAERHPSIGIVGAYGLWGGRVAWTGLTYPTEFISGREISRSVLLNGISVFGTATSVLYRAGLVRGRHPFYNESNLNCDRETSLDLLRSSDFGFVHQILSFTRIRTGSLSQQATELNSFAASGLSDVIKYGPAYLKPDEFNISMNAQLTEYYKSLARNVLRGRGRRFWEFHAKKLGELGIGLSRLRLARVFLGLALDAALNPKRTVEDLMRGKFSPFRAFEPDAEGPERAAATR